MFVPANASLFEEEFETGVYDAVEGLDFGGKAARGKFDKELQGIV